MAWRTRDLGPWIEALSPEIVMYSPVTSTPFCGRSAAAELFGVLFEEFGEMDLYQEFADTDTHAFFWRADCGGRLIEGADFMRHDEHGRIVEIRVLIRPLADIALFASVIGSSLAAGRSPTRGVLVRLLTFPLKGILRFADAVASRLINLR
jgi:hypothetical protein